MQEGIELGADRAGHDLDAELLAFFDVEAEIINVPGPGDGSKHAGGQGDALAGARRIIGFLLLNQGKKIDGEGNRRGFAGFVLQGQLINACGSRGREKNFRFQFGPIFCYGKLGRFGAGMADEDSRDFIQVFTLENNANRLAALAGCRIHLVHLRRQRFRLLGLIVLGLGCRLFLAANLKTNLARFIQNQDLTIKAADGNVFAVRTDGQGQKRFRLPGKDRLFHHALGIPGLDDPVFGHGIKRFAVGRINQFGDRPFMSEHGMNQLALFSPGFPDAYAPIGAGRGQMFAVRAPGHRIYPVGRFAERIEQLAIGDVPDLHRPIRRRGCQERTILAEGHAINRIAVFRERAQLLACICIPELDGGIVTSRRQSFAVGAEGHVENDIFVSRQDLWVSQGSW